MSSAIEELSFNFYFILINLNSHMGLVAVILDSAALNCLYLFPVGVTFDGDFSLEEIRNKH